MIDLTKTKTIAINGKSVATLSINGKIIWSKQQ